jgi:biotin operon repressor
MEHVSADPLFLEEAFAALDDPRFAPEDRLVLVKASLLRLRESLRTAPQPGLPDATPAETPETFAACSAKEEDLVACTAAQYPDLLEFFDHPAGTAAISAAQAQDDVQAGPAGKAPRKRWSARTDAIIEQALRHDVSYAVIAQELGVSRARLSRHIRALKNKRLAERRKAKAGYKLFAQDAQEALSRMLPPEAKHSAQAPVASQETPAAEDKPRFARMRPRQHLPWTPTLDARLQELASLHTSWNAIGQELGCPGDGARRRAAKLGLSRTLRAPQGSHAAHASHDSPAVRPKHDRRTGRPLGGAFIE